MSRRTPNILWICTDQQRFDTIHALGNQHIHTPNLDALCASGVAFTRCYSQSPVCTPSRASFLTGLYPCAIPVPRNGNERFPDNPRARLITRRLADAGYRCGLSGKLHIASAWNGVEERTDDGYDRFWYSHSPAQGIDAGNQYTAWLKSIGRFDEAIDAAAYDPQRHAGARYRRDVPAELHQTAWCADRAIEFMEESSGTPWLMSVNIFDPHPPFDAPESYASRYDADVLPPPLFDEADLTTQERLRPQFFQQYSGRPGPRQQRAIASYYGMVELIDEQVGRMVEVLERTGQRDDTVVVFTSDHGEMLGDHGLTAKGCRFYEGAVRVPLIVSCPDRFAQGVVHDGLVELTDLAPTIAELAGLEPAWTHGYSLVDALVEGSGSWEGRPFVRSEYHDALDRNAPSDDPDRRPSSATMYRDRRYKLVAYHGLEFGELYDLETDPGESTNLWDDLAHRELRFTLMRRSYDATVAALDPGPQRIGRY